MADPTGEAKSEPLRLDFDRPKIEAINIHR